MYTHIHTQSLLLLPFPFPLPHNRRLPWDQVGDARCPINGVAHADARGQQRVVLGVVGQRLLWWGMCKCVYGLYVGG